MSDQDVDILGRFKVKDEGSEVLSKVQGLTDGLGKAFGGLADIAKNALGFALGNVLTGALENVFGSMGELVSGALDAQKIQAQLAAVIESTGGAAGMTADAVLALSDSLAQSTLFTDDAITEAQNLLLTFTNIGKDVFPAATETLLDMAAAMGTDAKGGAIQLGKALNDPVAGISALSRVGVTFTEQQKEQIEAMVKVGDVAGAQKIILAELAKEFGGSAAAQAETLAGKLENLKKNLADTAEGMIASLLPAAEQLFDNVLAPAIPVVLDLMNAFGAFMATLAEGDIGGAFDALGEFDSVQLLGLGRALYDVGAIIEDTLAKINTIDFGPLMAAFTNLFTALGIQAPSGADMILGFANTVSFVVGLVVDLLNNYLIPAFAFVIDWLAANWPTIRATIETVVLAVQAVITTVLTQIQMFWAEWGDEIMAAVSFMVENVQIIFLAFSKAFEGDWRAFGETLRLAWDRAVKAIIELGGKIGEWFSSQDWGAIGSSIMESIAKAISNGAQWILDAALAAAQAAFEAVMGFFGGASSGASGGGAGPQTQTGPQLVGSSNYYSANSYDGSSAPRGSGGGNSTVNNYNVTINTPVRPDLNGELGLVTASAWQ
jgi:hypothetical protein